MRRGTTGRIPLAAAGLLVLAACAGPAADPTSSERDRLLDEAFAAMAAEPARAARLFEDAGPGPVLERARMAAWKSCLEHAGPTTEAWRRYISSGPPPDLAASARLHLVQGLIADGQVERAVAECDLLPESSRSAADELLLTVGDPEIRLAAARRLAVAAPGRLQDREPGLDSTLAASLSPEERLQRSRALRRAGLASRAARELRAVTWRGPSEIERRRELARAELAAGSPQAALKVLPAGRDAGAADRTLRALASRSRAWGMYPAGGARRAFADCTASAERALASPEVGEDRLAALELVLECATESGRLESALDAWRLLERMRWHADDREWLGRRLGVALAVAGDGPRALEIAAALPVHERCLRYWAAASTTGSAPVLDDLADAPVADLYAIWSRQALGRPPAPSPHWGPPVAAAVPPASVQRLLDAGARPEAMRQWRWIRDLRQTGPREALAAAELAAQAGFANDAIRWLRTGFPELGTVDLTAVPENAVTAYLPLRWPEALLAAAAESGLEPWLVAAVARQESTFTAHAESHRGAVGVLQLLPSTARVHARTLGLGQPPDLHDPELNIRLGALELARLQRKFGAIEPALAAYNAGETRVRGWWRIQPDPRRFAELIPVPETYTYVRRVMYLSEAYRLRYATTWKESR